MRREKSERCIAGEREKEKIKINRYRDIHDSLRGDRKTGDSPTLYAVI